MGRPLSRQQLFGANSKNNIKVQFHNGTESVKGYILEQTGSKRFKCSDINGNKAVCYLKAKASASLNVGEMSITVLDDNNVAYQITKIARHRVSYNGISAPWTFDADLTDGYVQMEEAGTDNQMTNAIDLEGDDIDVDYPIPGSGTYRTAAVALNGISYADVGTPYVPTGGVVSVSNSAVGLWRSKYDGNFTTNPTDTVSSYDLNWFTGKTPMASLADEYVSWGNQSDGAVPGQFEFSIDWKGYFTVPTTQKYNMYVESDDTMAVWVGSGATASPLVAGAAIVSSSNKNLPGQATSSRNSNSMTLTAGTYYPIRILFSEFTGGCKCQIYLLGEDGTKLNGDDLTLAYNTTTGGFNP